jgi:hypothetical protein
MAKQSKKKATKKAGAKKVKRSAPRKKARRLSAAELKKLQRIAGAGDFDSEAAFDLDVAIFEAADKGMPQNDDRITDLPEAAAQYWAAWWLEGEVNNGGFHQFFLNKGPVVAAVALRYVKENGPKDVAGMLERAIKALPKGALPKDSNAMMKILVPDDLDEDERLMAAMEKINDKFFDREGSLLEGRLRFALAHSSEFFD